MGPEYVIGRLESGPPPWTELAGLMSVLQMLQTPIGPLGETGNPADCWCTLSHLSYST